MQGNLTERSKQILEAIIEDYIATAEPVGSRAVIDKHNLHLSPATVRNVMVELEEMGLLASPHTSAGRIPTDKAYRLYVDTLLEVRRVTNKEREDIRQRCSLTGRDIAAVLRDTSLMLSSVSHYMGIVAAPKFAANVFRHIEFVKLGDKRILAILVSQNGTVQNRMIEADEKITGSDLLQMANYLNELLQGLTLGQVKQRLLVEMRNEKTIYDTLLAKALRLSQQTLEEYDSELFIEGQANFLEQPEFADAARMQEIFRAFEKKGHLLSLLDRCLTAQGINIFIGAETHLNYVTGMSLITSTYMTGKNTIGVLGVIGPTRMGYAKVIPIVDYTAKLVSKLLEVD